MTEQVFAVVPAAGIGSRMQADRPKQYLSLDNATILEHTVQRLLQFTPFQKIVLPLAKHDDYFPQLSLQHERLLTCDGGAERYHSVLNGIDCLLQHGAQVSDWVMVHDVARPCITQQDLTALWDARSDQGCILGMQVRDTMKRTDSSNQILNTVEREQLWHALTPQLAQIGVLKQAIETCIAAGHAITDEASALEYVGLRPHMVAGHPSNIKVTRPDDLIMAQLFVQEFK